MAKNKPGARPTKENSHSSASAETGQSVTAKEAAQLNTQELSLLETAIRRRVSGLVHARQPSEGQIESALVREVDLDHRLYPELDDRAAQLSGAETAISYRERFLGSLIDPDPRHHREMIDELLTAQIPIQTLAIHLFCPVATRLGTYWCNDEADFMQIAVASTRLNTIVNHVSFAGGQLISPLPSARRVLLARSHGTQHTLGITLVRMCFRDLGWIVDGGADMEIGDPLYMRLSEKPYDLIGLSVGQVDEKADCCEAITRFRSDPNLKHIKIALGGAAVLSHPEAFDDIGVDIMARSALEVVHLTDRFVN